jgi:hypothetical protein
VQAVLFEMLDPTSTVDALAAGLSFATRPHVTCQASACIHILHVRRVGARTSERDFGKSLSLRALNRKPIEERDIFAKRLAAV